MGEVDETSSALMDINEAAASICNAHMTPSYDVKISNRLSFKLSYTFKCQKAKSLICEL